MSAVIERIREELRLQADEKTLTSGPRFFKETVKLYGVKTAIVSTISKAEYKNLEMKDKAEVFQLCEELWQSGYLEEAFIACNWAYSRHQDYGPEDFAMFEHWITNYVSNWASCDTLCNHTVGALLVKYPEFVSQLRIWAKSDNRWLRRASAVSLIIPAKEGKFITDIFAIADILLLDKDDLVLKGYGWLLKEASRNHQTEVFDYVMNNKKVMPRTALRYAIEKMPEDFRRSAMAK